MELSAAGATREADELDLLLVEKFPSAESYSILAHQRIVESRWAEAVQAIEKSLTHNKNFGSAYHHRAICFMHMHKYKEALGDLQHAKSLGVPLLHTGLLEVRCRMQSGDYTHAYRLCEEVSKICPGPEADLLAFDCLMKMQRPDRFALAEKKLKHAVSWSLPDMHVWVSRYITLLQSREMLTSTNYRRSLDQLIHAYPRRWEFYSARGYYYLTFRDHDKAMADFSKSIDLGCPVPTVYITRSKLYEDELLGEKALSDVQHALQLAPSLAECYKQRAHVYRFLLDRYDLADKDLLTCRLLESKNQK